MSEDLHANVKISKALALTAVSGNGATAGSIIDTQGFGNTEFAIISGTLTDGTYTPSLTEGDDSALGDGATVAAAEILGTIALATFALTDDNTVKKIGYKGNKRYVRLTITASVVTTGGLIGAIAIQGDPQSAPVA